jgi:hypothetical protein
MNAELYLESYQDALQAIRQIRFPVSVAAFGSTDTIADPDDAMSASCFSLAFMIRITGESIDFLNLLKENISSQRFVAVNEKISQYLEAYRSSQAIEVNALAHILQAVTYNSLMDQYVRYNIKPTSGHYCLLAIEQEMISALEDLKNSWRLPKHLEENVLIYIGVLSALFYASLIAATTLICLSPVSWLVFLPTIMLGLAEMILGGVALLSREMVSSYDSMLSNYRHHTSEERGLHFGLRGEQMPLSYMSHFFHQAVNDDELSLSDEVDTVCRENLNAAPTL